MDPGKKKTGLALWRGVNSPMPGLRKVIEDTLREPERRRISHVAYSLVCQVAYILVSTPPGDGVIEAVESRDFSERWLIGVQWDPEGMRKTSPEHRDLFEAHVGAAGRYALRRAA